MLFASLYIIPAILAFASRAAAHGQVTGIVAGGKYYKGYVPSEQGGRKALKLAGWSIPQDTSNGPVYPLQYGSPSIICNLGATAGVVSVQVEAGSTVELEWTQWPVTHHGPVLDYLAHCNGECDAVDKTSLKFNKIDAVGLLGESTGPGAAGFWGSDKLREANNTWTVTIPSTIAPGNYVLRHEIIALHSARTINGAQNYPHCVNLQVSGSGSDSLPSGTLGTALYKPGQPGIEIDIYKPLKYTMPGPPLYNAGATSSSSDSGGSSLGGGLDNLGMGVVGSVSISSPSSDSMSASPTSSTEAENMSQSMPADSPIATSIPMATATPGVMSAPWSNSTGFRTSMANTLPQMTSSVSIATSTPSIDDSLQAASSIVNDLPTSAVGSVPVNTPFPTYPASSAAPDAIDTAAQQTTPAFDSTIQQTTPALDNTTPQQTTPVTTQPTTYPSLPLNPSQSTFSGMTVSQLMAYLRAIVAALSQKMAVGGGAQAQMRRRHSRELKQYR